VISKPYESHQPTDFVWMGTIPTIWKIKRVGHHVDLITGFAFRSDDFSFEDGIRLVRGDNVTENMLRWGDKTRYWPKIDKSLEQFLLKENDILIGMDGSKVGKNFAIVKDSDLPLLLVQRVARLRVDGQLSYKFLSYLIGSDFFRVWVSLNKTDPAIPHISPSDIRCFPLPYPSIHEQVFIANFLDHETAKIDTLIDKQQQLIKLLKEKRQAVISHAVTKGLNPNVPMKDSGVEWLGNVPEHWIVKSYRYACRIYRGKFGHRPRNDPAFYDGDYPFIQTGDVARAGKVISSYSQTLNEKGRDVSQLFPAGTLMMTIAANIGDTAILGFEAYAPDSVVGFNPYANVDIEFLRYSFMAALPALEQASTQSTQANLNVDRIGAVKAVFPPYEQQLSIVRYLDKLLHHYDLIEFESMKAISLMQERRSALISAAVTGKIDVRQWQAPARATPATTQEARV
jgi:type I restriction enzyme, S subunit